MSQDLPGINKPRSSTGSTGAVGGTTHAKAVGQGASADSNRQFQNPHDDKHWDSYTPSLITPAPENAPENGPENIVESADDTPLLLSISALQAMLEDPQNLQFTNPNERALWLSRLVLLRSRGWAQVPWPHTENLLQVLQRLWHNAGFKD